MRKVARISQTHPAMSSVGGHAMPSTGTVGGARGVGGAAAVAAAAAAAALKASTAPATIMSLQPLVVYSRNCLLSVHARRSTDAIPFSHCSQKAG